MNPKIELHGLGAVCDDYESASSVGDDTRLSSHLQVTEEEIGQCLAGLFRKSMLAVFQYDPESPEYVLEDDWEGNEPERWFLISPSEGRHLEANRSSA